MLLIGVPAIFILSFIIWCIIAQWRVEDVFAFTALFTGLSLICMFICHLMIGGIFGTTTIHNQEINSFIITSDANFIINNIEYSSITTSIIPTINEECKLIEYKNNFKNYWILLFPIETTYKIELYIPIDKLTIIDKFNEIPAENP